MQYKKDKKPNCRALTLLEMVIALAIMTIVIAAVLPQFRIIQNTWDSKRGDTELLQNGRVLAEHLSRYLSQAVRITAVSDSSETNGYIQFEDNAGDIMRYDIGTNDYVQFGSVSSLSDLAGPVSQLQFTCYDANDFDDPTTDVNSIRFVNVQTTLTNSAALGRDKTFTANAYLRTNYQDDDTGWILTKLSTSWYEFNTTNGRSPALCQINDTHYLCAYEGDGEDGWAVVLEINTTNWSITPKTPFEYDTQKDTFPALAKIDGTHYLCAYQGEGDDGWAVVLTVNTGNWNITTAETLEFDIKDGRTPALCQIDNTHYLCAYEGDGSDGWAVVLTVNTGTWNISAETPSEFDATNGQNPALAEIDDTHYLCAYRGPGDDGWAVVLTVNTGTWNISAGTPFEFDTANGMEPELSQINSTHYLCAYRGPGDDGWVVVLTVNTGTWTITKNTPFEYDTQNGEEPALSKIDDTHYLCAYRGNGDDGWAVVLTVDNGLWSITEETPLEFDTQQGLYPTLSKIDDTHYLCAYEGVGNDGWAVVLSLGPPLLP